MLKKLFALLLCLSMLTALTGCRQVFSTLDDIQFAEFYDDNISEHVDIISSKIETFDVNEFKDKYFTPDDEKFSDTNTLKSADEIVPWEILNDNCPDFDTDDITTDEFEIYSKLDELGRCGVAFANISPATMPTEERGSIGMIKPAGWHTVKYDCVDGKYLYNRCHLIGYQLAGENANELNLITGTRYLNIEGMLDFENQVADYVKETGNHVLYRVTPIYIDNELLCRGVQMEAYSVEDKGEGICFNILAYNIQPGIEIDYATGDSRLIE